MLKVVKKIGLISSSGTAGLNVAPLDQLLIQHSASLKLLTLIFV